MNRSNRASRSAFTLIEMIAVVAILGIMLSIAGPAFMQILRREKHEGFLRSAVIKIEQARGEAAKLNLPVTVRADFALNAFVANVDLNGDGVDDRELFYLALPSSSATDQGRLRFWAAEHTPDDPMTAIDGLTVRGGERVLILEPDGSVRDRGAFRFGTEGASTLDNFYEIRIEPAATPGIRLRKWLWEEADDRIYKRYRLRQGATGPIAWPWY
jgi:prepilin-type N-terminal cleavage/methylation domain-containing protein